MKSEIEIKKKLEELMSDERMSYETATVFENAPLALIQMGMGAQINTYEEILELPLSRFPLKKKKSNEK